MYEGNCVTDPKGHGQSYMIRQNENEWYLLIIRINWIVIKCIKYWTDERRRNGCCFRMHQLLFWCMKMSYFFVVVTIYCANASLGRWDPKSSLWQIYIEKYIFITHYVCFVHCNIPQQINSVQLWQINFDRK